jgi:hypothetical protein
MNKKRLILIIIALLIAAAGLYDYAMQKETQRRLAESTPPTGPWVYTNSDYGFTFDMPADWRGLSIVQDKWQGYSSDEKGQVLIAEGVQFSFRHPLWRPQEPRQDIPIMFFTLKEWNDLQVDKFHIGAAPINPRELGRNNVYVFALPARYNFAYLTGYEDVEKILEGNPLHPFDIAAK